MAIDIAWARTELAQHREAAQRADVALVREAEVRERLGDNAPQISASAMHP
ncbi:hypothetical protein [Streptomyces sp. A0592]|uniref:hypothetical protein n=1 Tax=Streptomyces sp. A0592 TaxID=2563099 RepID=UPI0014485186|nr:hypothetical protein [Streptomyces sp. A0592]